MSKESFKIFARSHPELVSHVMSGDVTWQKLYELFDIYGDDNEIWDKYISNNIGKYSSFKDVFNSIKRIDLDSFQKGVDNLQKTIGLIQGLPIGNSIDKPYVPRDIYHHMED